MKLIVLIKYYFLQIRLYGGIHYIMAINNGVAQYEQVGKHVMNKIQTRITN